MHGNFNRIWMLFDACLLLDFGRRKQKHDTKRLSLKRIRVLFPKVETSKNAQTYLAEKVTKI